MPKKPRSSNPRPDTQLPHDIHASDSLRELIKAAPGDTFTLEWLINRLPNRSFGIILLFLAAIAILPVVSIPARILILVLTFELIIGFRAPTLPIRLMKRPMPSRHLTGLERYAIPVLKLIEPFVRPRFYGYMLAMRHVAALSVFLLTLVSLIVPFPLANVPPAIISIFMALAYIEHDGLLFMIAFIFALAFLTLIGFVILSL